MKDYWDKTESVARILNVLVRLMIFLILAYLGNIYQNDRQDQRRLDFERGLLEALEATGLEDQRALLNRAKTVAQAQDDPRFLTIVDNLELIERAESQARGLIKEQILENPDPIKRLIPEGPAAQNMG